jgi:hypothetical protein
MAAVTFTAAADYTMDNIFGSVHDARFGVLAIRALHKKNSSKKLNP